MKYRSQDTRDERIILTGIQHFCLKDGQGIRTVIFFKGCPLRCLWCGNPETYSEEPELCHVVSACIGTDMCGDCLISCPHDALYRLNSGAVGVDRDACVRCGRCAEGCPSRALSICGQSYTLESILEEIEIDERFIRRSGGVTLSGGEPFMHMRFAARLLSELRQRGIHSAVETCGFFDMDSEFAAQALHSANVIYYDIKHADPAKHKHGTGMENSRILQNLKRLGQEYPSLPIVTRTPVIPGFNDTPEAMIDIARIVSSIPTVEKHELIPYYPYGETKFVQLERPCLYSSRVRISRERLDSFATLFRNVGIPTSILR